MSEEVVQETTSGAVESGQTGERPRKSRKRGKRNRSRANESGFPVSSDITEPAVEATPPASSPPRERERAPRRSSSERTGSNGYRDGFDRYFCVSGLRFYPREWPVTHRAGLAIARLQEVDRRERELLICDQLHDGPCFWPDGEPAAEHVVARRESFEPAPRTPIPTAEPEPAMDGDA